MWKKCEPFSNPTVKRMLTVAHGTFCLVDAGDAVGRALVSGGGTFNVVEFVLRLNVVGVGRLPFRCTVKQNVLFLMAMQRERLISQPRKSQSLRTT